MKWLRWRMRKEEWEREVLFPRYLSPHPPSGLRILTWAQRNHFQEQHLHHSLPAKGLTR